MTFECTCEAVLDAARATQLVDVFPDGHVPIRSPVPRRVRFDGLEGAHDVYDVDLGRLTREQRALLVDKIAARFGTPPVQVEAEFRAKGHVLRSTGCMVWFCAGHSRLLAT